MDKIIDLREVLRKGATLTYDTAKEEDSKIAKELFMEQTKCPICGHLMTKFKLLGDKTVRCLNCGTVAVLHNSDVEPVCPTTKPIEEFVSNEIRLFALNTQLASIQYEIGIMVAKFTCVLTKADEEWLRDRLTTLYDNMERVMDRIKEVEGGKING